MLRRLPDEPLEFEYQALSNPKSCILQLFFFSIIEHTILMSHAILDLCLDIFDALEVKQERDIDVSVDHILL
jgi:hypothetical protein